MVDLETRLLSRRKIVGDCWLYDGYINDHGYGEIWYEGETERVNRISAMLYLGFDLASKSTINHKKNCTSKRCFNPDHLYIGNQFQNMQDASEILIKVSKNGKKTHCPQGHEYSKENTYITKNPRNGRDHRNCRACQNAAVRRRYHQRRATSATKDNLN